MRGKPWTPDELRQLQQLIEEGASLDVICKKMIKTKDSIQQKCYDLKLTLKEEEEVVKKKLTAFSSSSSGLVIPKELQSIEENLKDLLAAKEALKKGGLTKVEILRLTKIMAGCRFYHHDFADYFGYRELEMRLDEVDIKLAEMAKKQRT